MQYETHGLLELSDRWYRFEWTRDVYGNLYYCRSGEGDTMAEALFLPSSDATDILSGCGAEESPWRLLSPM